MRVTNDAEFIGCPDLWVGLISFTQSLTRGHVRIRLWRGCRCRISGYCFGRWGRSCLTAASQILGVVEIGDFGWINRKFPLEVVGVN